MEWFNIQKDGYPNTDQRVLTYSEVHEGRPDLAYRILDGQFIKICTDVTHWTYLRPPNKDK
jgi:hypothetical protein